MTSGYKRLGDYIQLVDERNKSLEKLPLMGLSVSKVFFPTIANLVGTDMSTYKIVYRNQFTYIADTSRRGDKIAIALNEKFDKMLVSQAYTPFEVKDESKLHPEYLMMWFRRTEFDRYARFKSHGSAREIFDWQEMCDVMLPIPSQEKQQQLVNEYHTLQKRIDLNNQLIAKLEETAQTIYKQWFVEGIDLENLPEGWRLGKLTDLIEVKYGKAYSHLEKGTIPLYGSGGLMGKVNKALYSKPSVLIPRKGTLSNIMFVNEPFWCVDTMFYSIFNDDVNGYYSFYILKQLDFNALDQGSAVPSMTSAFLNSIDVVLPTKDSLTKFNNSLKKIVKHKEIIEKENLKLNELKELLLGEMAKGELKKI
ncbi:restriction endonuclease subunit S [Flavobacterium sp. CYK-4]|uniref:restriction endonuclease subunit S n=1 Tax=Flavobacterium lotistagni TaxID=2709660 RepID=UPI001408BB03|nr:restriction endonuclease subunit S [Flavobacterium lotistagni]NHM08042.1 restriction endonuclease subunit S [Flavobacterium lotistagni]